MNELPEIIGTPTPAPLPASALNDLENEVKELEACYKLAEGLCGTALVPKQYMNKPADGAVAILWGRHLGLNSTASLQNIAVINGTPTLWGDALVALVKGNPVCKYLTTSWDQENFTAIVKTQREGEPEETRTYSWEDASRAGLAQRDTYQKHPKRMLQARARSHLLRDVYADLLKGFQIREILEEDADMYGLGEKEIQQVPNTESDTLRELASPETEGILSIEDFIIGAKTSEDFEQARSMIRELADGKEKERLKVVWKMNMEEVKSAAGSE